VNVWRYNSGGLAQVDRLPELDESNTIASATPVIRFCLDETGERMVYQEWYGLRAGFGAILALNRKREWGTERQVWKS
jgi:hypothetical protein